MTEQTPEQWAREILERHYDRGQHLLGRYCGGCEKFWPCDAVIGARHVLAQAEALDFGPVVTDEGFVWLHIHRGKNAVVLRYPDPKAGYEDMRVLKEWAEKVRAALAGEDGWDDD
jgi:hypothetical protein